MLAELGIYALSIELGSSQDKFNTFFIEEEDDLKTLLLETEPWIRQIMTFLDEKTFCYFMSSSVVDEAVETDGKVKAVISFVCAN